MSKTDDAWKQLHKLLEKFTRNWEVRKDIEVVARACDRGVELILWDHAGERACQLSTGKRNVSTMRELAAALTAACDFVDASNPIWAGMATSWPAKDTND